MAKREKVHRLGLTDPRSGPERVAAVVNRIASGNRKEAVRFWEDSPTDMAKKRKKKGNK
jgi:hypothetical protein